MGLEGVSEFIRKKYPGAITNSHLSEFAFKSICVDISGFIYRYMSMFGKENNQWLKCFANLILLFRENHIHFIPVFDGKAPKEKIIELQSRKDAKESITDRLQKVEEDLQNYYTNNVISDSLKDVIKKDKSKEGTKVSILNYLITEEKQGEKEILQESDIEIINNFIKKNKNYGFTITKDDTNLLKELFDVFNVPYIQAPAEAEQTCCALVNKGICYAIISNDTDCIAHRANIFIFNLDTQKGDIKYIKKKDLIKELEFEEDQQLTDFGILVGCDYNRSKKIKNMGPVKVHSLVKQYKNLETIKEKLNIDIESIDYIRCRELFNHDLTLEEKNIKRWIKPNIEEIKEFCMNHDIFIDFKKLDRIFNKTIKINFID